MSNMNNNITGEYGRGCVSILNMWLRSQFLCKKAEGNRREREIFLQFLDDKPKPQLKVKWV